MEKEDRRKIKERSKEERGKLGSTGGRRRKEGLRRKGELRRWMLWPYCIRCESDV